jgi:hypothetical protein
LIARRDMFGIPQELSGLNLRLGRQQSMRSISRKSHQAVFLFVCVILGPACGGGGGGGSPGGGGPGPAPSIATITPGNGPATGGNSITIAGANFVNPVTSVTFGAAPAAIVSQTPTQIVVTAPGGVPGALTVTVKNPDSQTATIGYTYNAAAPLITSITPADDHPAGGATATITGYNFGNPVTSVTFGAAPAAIISQSTSRIVVTAPAGAAGPVTVTVTNPGLLTATTTFTYRANVAPRITTTFPVNAVVHAGETRTFTVTATDPDGNPVTLRLLNPPPGCIFPPASGAASPVVRELRWVVSPDSGGLQRLVFQASDNQLPPNVSKLSVDVQVLGNIHHSSLVIADVTGDGILDVVCGARYADIGGVTDVGAIYVWAGMTTPTGAPTAILRVPGAQTGDLLSELGFTGSQGIQCVDVTGDGIPDIVVGAVSADLGATQNAGAIYVWAGGPGLIGTVSPTARLTCSPAFFNDALGGWSGQGIVCADVTGDGIPDIVAGRVFSLHFWRGGPGLSGNLAPTATLSPSSLGIGSTVGQTIEIADVTGDGILDVIAGDPGAGTGGRVYVYAGGPGFGISAGASLSVPGAVSGDNLGVAGEQGILFADVTGDGILDIIVAAEQADVGGVQDAGAIYVWAGGAGLMAGGGPRATLTVPGAVAFDRLVTIGWGRTLQTGDVTGDGVADIVAAAVNADVGGVVDTGAVYVWAGGAGLTGTVAPTAKLTVPGAVAGDNLSSILLANVTGTSTFDVIVGATQADVGGVLNAGAIYVWTGGAGLTGTPAPNATLKVTGAAANDQLGEGSSIADIQAADVTGDGVLDIVVAATFADIGGVQNTGAIYVWAGGAGLTGTPSPTATLAVAGASTGDGLGGAPRQGIQLADVTGDGTLDIVAGAPGATVGGTSARGRIYVWAGGAGLTGTPAPTAILSVPSSVQDDRLGDIAQGQGILIADVTGDGILDIVAATKYANIGGVQDTGALYTWAGGAGLTGTIAPTATLVVSGAAMGDALAAGIGQAFRLADLTGDGIADIIAATPGADPGGVTSAGAIYFWAGGAGLTGTPALTATFAVPGALPMDMLGN